MSCPCRDIVVGLRESGVYRVPGSGGWGSWGLSWGCLGQLAKPLRISLWDPGVYYWLTFMWTLWRPSMLVVRVCVNCWLLGGCVGYIYKGWMCRKFHVCRGIWAIWLMGCSPLVFGGDSHIRMCVGKFDCWNLVFAVKCYDVDCIIIFIGDHSCPMNLLLWRRWSQWGVSYAYMPLYLDELAQPCEPKTVFFVCGELYWVILRGHVRGED